MKSKKAIDHIIQTWWHDKQIINVSDAEQAVELAEEDARERAVKAYCKSVYGVFCDDCDSCDFDADTCERRNEYLKAYNNEE